VFVVSDAGIVVCIAAHDDESSIAKVVLGSMAFAYKVIVCDDGSSDMTADIARKLGAVVVRHEQELGYGSALRSMFVVAKRSKPSIIVTLDANGQHDPRFIPDVTKPVQEGTSNVVIGSRFLPLGAPPPVHNDVGTSTVNLLSEGLTAMKLTDPQSGYRAYDPTVLAITIKENGVRASSELLQKCFDLHLKIKEVAITPDYPVESHSSAKSPVQASEVIAGRLQKYSVTHPFLLYGIPGTFLLIIGLLFAARSLLELWGTGAISTNLEIAALGFLLGGSVLLVTAVILFVVTSLVKGRSTS
jgi:glycosyltransferase involved in cell wall biosynthesis